MQVPCNLEDWESSALPRASHPRRNAAPGGSRNGSRSGAEQRSCHCRSPGCCMGCPWPPVPGQCGLSQRYTRLRAVFARLGQRVTAGRARAASCRWRRESRARPPSTARAEAGTGLAGRKDRGQERTEPDEVQPGQGQGPAPGEEQPQAPVQAGAALLESSSAERDWECWGTTG